LWPLGARSACLWVRPAVKADIQKFQPATKVVIRVNAPEHYRKFFKTNPKPDSPADILTELASLQLTKASVLSGGDWRREKTLRIDQLIGHLRVSPELAQKLVLCSGRKGIFLTQTKVTDGRETMRWIEKQGKEDPEAYLARCLKEADSKGLRFRSGGGRDLGYILPPGQQQQGPQVVSVQGIPKDWDTEDVLSFLQSVAWESCSTLGRRSMGRNLVAWLVKGIPPSDPQNNGFLAVRGLLRKQLRPKQKVQTTPVQPPRRSFKQKFGENSVNIPVPHNEDMAHEETLETKETEGPPARRPRTTAQAPPAVHPADDILQSFLSEGWKVHDLGGCGDCGYRSIAGALAYAKDGSILSPEEAQRQGALVRTQAVQHLRKHLNEFKEFILPDVNTSPSQPAPNQDQVVEQYLWESSQPNTWIDGVTLLAAAHKQGCPFIIWFSHEGYWKRCTLATAFDQKGNAKCARDKSPIILRLQGQHYSWIQPLHSCGLVKSKCYSPSGSPSGFCGRV
jgi:hypothetical protein